KSSVQIASRCCMTWPEVDRFAAISADSWACTWLLSRFRSPIAVLVPPMILARSASLKWKPAYVASGTLSSCCSYWTVARAGLWVARHWICWLWAGGRPLRRAGPALRRPGTTPGMQPEQRRAGRQQREQVRRDADRRGQVVAEVRRGIGIRN